MPFICDRERLGQLPSFFHSDKLASRLDPSGFRQYRPSSVGIIDFIVGA